MIANTSPTIIGFSELLAEETDGIFAEKHKHFLEHIRKDSLYLFSHAFCGRADLMEPPMVRVAGAGTAMISL